MRVVNITVLGYMRFMARPPKLTEKKLLTLTPELAQRISDFRFARRIPSETEAIRQLIEAGLRAEESRSQ